MESLSKPVVAQPIMAAAIALSLCSVGYSEVLYNSIGMVSKGTANSTTQPAFIGYYQNQDVFVDVNVAEDFVLNERYAISTLTMPFRLAQSPDADLPNDGILVEFFENSEINRPTQQPIAAVLATEYEAELFKYPGIEQSCWYFTVDLTDYGIELGPGTWWVSITPVDTTERAGDWRVFQSGGSDTQIINNPVNRRWGGKAHGTYPPSFFYIEPEWAPFPGSGSNLAIAIDGDLATSNPAGDLNGDNVVDVFDLLILLGAWGDCANPEDCPSDLNGDEAVNVFDLLILLGQWG